MDRYINVKRLSLALALAMILSCGGLAHAEDAEPMAIVEAVNEGERQESIVVTEEETEPAAAYDMPVVEEHENTLYTEPIEEAVLYHEVVFFVGDAYTILTVPDGWTVEWPADPWLEGHVFSHWFQSGGDDTTPYDFARAVTGPLTLVAYFNPAAETIQYPEEMDNTILTIDDGDMVPQDANNNEEDTVSLDNFLTGLLITLDDEPGSVDLPEITLESLLTDEEPADKVPATPGEDSQPTTDEPLDGPQIIEITDRVEPTEETLAPATDNEADTVEILDTDIPMAGPAPVVSITAQFDGMQLQEGDMVTLVADVSTDGRPYELNWMYNDGTGWKTIDGANQASYSYAFSSQNYSWYWDVQVTVLDNTGA